jgi:uncharacterized protein YegL
MNPSSVRSSLICIAFAGLAVAGCSSELPEDMGSTSLEVRATGVGKDKDKDDSNSGSAAGASSGEETPAAGNVGTGVSVRDRNGSPVPANRLRIQVETRTADGPWRPATDLVVDERTKPTVDVMVVADNSGSVKSELDDIRDALGEFSRALLTDERGDRLGLVRVSTESVVLSELTDDAAHLDAAAARMYTNQGWTALWDGIRLANDTLQSQSVRRGSTGQACYLGSLPVILVMTDGADNNSADEHETRYAGDGIDTTLAHLESLNVNGRNTTVHAVAVGDGADVASLQQLASARQGHFTHIKNYFALMTVLQATTKQLDAMVPVCFTAATCTDSEARISVQVDHEGETASTLVALPDELCTP